MKISLYVLFFSVLIMSCGGEKAEEGKPDSNEKKEKKEDTLEEVKADTLIITPDYKNPYPSDLSASDKRNFKEILGDSLTAEMFALSASYDSVSTHRQMMIYYRALIDFQNRSFMQMSEVSSSEEFYNKIVADKAKKEETIEEYEVYSIALEVIQEKLKNTEKYLSGLEMECTAECTEPYYEIRIKTLMKKAATTEGNDDDDFFNFLMAGFDCDFEPGTMSAVWFEPTWDLGGMSLLGSGKHTEFLQETDQLLDDKNIFSEWILKYRAYCIADASDWFSFAYSKEKVLAELKSMLKKVKLTENEKDAIRAQIKDIENGTEEHYQFDCKTNDCSYG